MNPSLSSDTTTCIFQFLRLRDIIILTIVSKQLRQIALSKKYWYVISDTRKILYDFVRKILQSGIPESHISNISNISNVLYPFNKIRKMNSIDDCHELCSPELLKIFPHSSQDCAKFYEYFANYQYLYVCEKNHVNINKSFKGIYVCQTHLYRKYYVLKTMLPQINTITEFIAPGHHFDCQTIIEWYPCIEKLNVANITAVELL